MIGVIHVITRLDLGGAQENTLDSAARLDPSRFLTALVYGPGGLLDGDAEKLSHVHREPLRVLVREASPSKDPAALIGIAAALRRSIDALRSKGARSIVVHTHGSKAGILGRFAAKLAQVDRVVHTIHGFGFHVGQSPAVFAAYVALERAAARVTDTFVSVSRACLAEAMARGIVGAGHQHRVIRSGFELAPFLEAPRRRAEARAALGLHADQEALVSVANLKPQKDPMTLVEAFSLVARRRPNAVLLFAGDGELRGAVEARLAELRLADRFRLLGWRRDVPELLAAADVAVLSSIFEGLPRSAVQALAARVPVVATRVDGTSEVVREGRNGYLVEPRDPSALARAIGNALDLRPVDPSDRALVREFDVSVMVRSLEALYVEVAT
ncbi:MAG: glycosyltransferase [Deltaproteobacteria bacterium]|nr:glycosyltransferase [Deltaproteobacteria bacterium]